MPDEPAIPTHQLETLKDMAELGRVKRNNVPWWKELIAGGWAKAVRMEGVICLVLTSAGEAIATPVRYVFAPVSLGCTAGYEIATLGRKIDTEILLEFTGDTVQMLIERMIDYNQYEIQTGRSWPGYHHGVLVIRYRVGDELPRGVHKLHFDRIEGEIPSSPKGEDRWRTAEEVFPHFTRWSDPS